MARVFVLWIFACVATCAPVLATTDAAEPNRRSGEAEKMTLATPYVDKAIDAEGVGIKITLSPVQTPSAPLPRAGEEVELRVSLRRLADAQPLSNLPVGLWLDRQVSPLSGAVPSCNRRIADVLSGGLLSRPLLDLTGYWVLTLDQEGGVSVLDPAVNFAGRSSLYKSIRLGSAPFDWIKRDDDSALFVALPDAKAVAAIDLRTLSLSHRTPIEGKPTRLGLQPDGRLLWVAARGEAPQHDSLSAIDTGNGSVMHRLNLPSGHHELAFSEDSRFVYVSSRDSGRLAVIDSASGRQRAEIALGGQLLALLSVPARREVWAVDGAGGLVHRLDANGESLGRTSLEPGLGPIRLSPDGRFALIVNPAQHKLYVLSSEDGRLLGETTISGKPYDLIFSAQYVYVRGLDSEQVAMLPLAQLPDMVVKYVTAGEDPVSALPGLSIAPTMSPNFERTGAFFLVPSERTLYHYMEGMNAPDSSIRAYGHTPIAVALAQRGLREVSRGEYATRFRLPASGNLVFALAADAPKLRECLGVRVAPAASEAQRAGLKIEWLGEALVKARVGTQVELRFRVDAGSGHSLPPATRLTAKIVPGGGGHAMRWTIETAGRDGEYRIVGALSTPGGYYVHIEADSNEFDLDAMNAPAALIALAAPSSADR
jgi:DNA-binding beta-propeller fold protein YncE